MRERGSVPIFSEPKMGTDPVAAESGGQSPFFRAKMETDPSVMGTDPAFRRDPDLPGLNSFLNYGYAVVRAAVARAIVAAGLLPSLGLHHRNRSNAFCLADDLVEPLRPLVDDRVRDERSGKEDAEAERRDGGAEDRGSHGQEPGGGT